MRPPYPAALLALLSAAPLAAQANATASLMTYGDLINGPCTAQMSGLTPGATTYLIPSLNNGGSSYLVGLSGDPNDALAVGLDLASGGTYFTGTSTAQGGFTRGFTLAASAGMLDRKVYWQGFTRPGGAGAAMFADFTNLRVMTLNQANRWQPAGSDFPVASANLGFCVLATGASGRATEIFLCGGGPALVTSSTTPYPTLGQAWIYDAVREEHRLLPGGMNVSRAFHGVVRLSDGRVLAAGGVTFGGQSGANYYTSVLNSAEIYDPVAGTWALTPPMNAYRAGCTANLLPDGRVLVAGGTEGNAQHQLFDTTDLLTTSLRSTEIYDPVANTWSAGPNLPTPKAGGASIALNDGRILIAGGITYEVILGIPFPDFSNKAYLYNPATNSFTTSGMATKRALFGITKLLDGRVLCAGGAGGDILSIGPIRQAEIYNPATNQFTAVQGMPFDSAFPVAVTLPDGRGLVVGGATGNLDDPVPIATCQTYDPATNTWTTVDPLDLAHGGGGVAMLEDGTVYCGGGETGTGSATTEAETYSP